MTWRDSTLAAIKHYVLVSGREDDPGFKRLIERLTRTGLIIAAIAGGAFTILYVTAHIVLIGRMPSFNYGAVGDDIIVLWDKLGILATALMLFVLARTQLGSRYGRQIIGAMVVALVAATLADDIASGHRSFSLTYVSLLLLGVVGTMPFKPLQTLAIGSSVAALLFVAMLVMPEMLGPTGVRTLKISMVYIGLLIILLTSVSSLIYTSRSDQYLARRRVEQLNHDLHERTIDLSQKKDEIERQRRRIVEMEELKSRFFANLSHEFRTPLTLIIGPLMAALDGGYGPLDDRLAHRLSVMHSNASRLQRLIDEMLDLASLDAGRLVLSTETHDLGALVRRILFAFSGPVDEKHIDIRFDGGAGIFVSIDPARFEHVVGNVVSNAIKYTPAGGSIRVSLEIRDEMAVLRVRDSGRGIPQAHLPHVFDRFYRVPEERTQHTVGWGLGLALARELVELHGGLISATSEEGFGTEVVVSMPFVTADTGSDSVCARSASSVIESHAGWSAAETPAADAPCVLLVDDNAAMRSYVRDVLASRYQVIEASNGTEGIAMALETLPDLIISDVMMEGMDGFEMCRVIRENPATQRLPIILLTARADDESTIEGIEAGADDYILKPFAPAQLRARVENLIDLRRALSRPSLLALDPVDVVSEDERFLKQVKSKIEENIGNVVFGVEWLAGDVSLSTRQLQRRIRALTGLSAANLIRMMRMQRAIQLLEARSGSVAHVATAVGFRDVSHFSKVFKQAFGVAPSDYTKSDMNHHARRAVIERSI